MADDRRIDEDGLDRRIADAKASQAAGAGVTQAQARAEGRGWAVGIEFIGTILVCGLIGWFADRYFGTSPWGLIILLILGFAAGTRRAMSTSKQFDANPGNDPR